MILYASGQQVVIDDIDAPLAHLCAWQFHNGHVCHPRKGYLARLILGAPRGRYVQYRNGPLDLRRCNIVLVRRRVCDAKGGPRRGRKFKGVYRMPSGRYRAAIKFAGEQRHISAHDTEVDAARAYNRVARMLFGRAAYLNKV